MNEKLVFNYIVDLKKNEINCFERAEIIQDFLTTSKISIRELARRTGLRRSTIEDWLRWKKLTSEEYLSMKKKGMNDTDIYRYLRTGSTTKTEKIQALDFELNKVIKTFSIFLLDPPYSKDTIFLLDRAITKLESIKENIEKRSKNEAQNNF